MCKSDNFQQNYINVHPIFADFSQNFITKSLAISWYLFNFLIQFLKAYYLRLLVPKIIADRIVIDIQRYYKNIYCFLVHNEKGEGVHF